MSPGREPSRPAAERQITVGQAGVGNWGKNLVRNFDELARLRWICDPSQESRAQFGGRYPAARVTERFDDLLEDDELDAVIIATPVPTHHELARRALEAGKHVFVEKPPAMRGAEMEELLALAEARGLVLMPGHLLLYHPGLRHVKHLVDGGGCKSPSQCRIETRLSKRKHGPFVPGVCPRHALLFDNNVLCLF